MLIASIIKHNDWSGRIRRRGIRRVARQAGIDVSYLSRIVNNKVVCSEKMLKKLLKATNELLPICQLKGEL